MANTLTGLFQTLVVPAAIEAAKAAKFRNVMAEYVYTQYRGLHGEYGNQLNVNIPIVNEGNVTEIGAGPIQPTDRVHTTVPLTINHNLSDSFVIRSFEQLRTPLDMRTLWMDAAMEETLRKINRQIANLVSAAAFPNYATITGGANVFSRLNVSQGWSNLVNAGAPMNPGDLFFVTTPTAYGTMLGDPAQNFIQQFFVGEAAAVAAQQTAKMMPLFQAQLDYDQQLPTPGGKQSGLFFHRYAIAMIPVRQPPSQSSLVDEMYVFPRGDIPIRVQFWYDPVQQGWVVHINVVFALAVVRPEFGSYFQSA